MKRKFLNFKHSHGNKKCISDVVNLKMVGKENSYIYGPLDFFAFFPVSPHLSHI